jgi:hypothetical protein
MSHPSYSLLLDSLRILGEKKIGKILKMQFSLASGCFLLLGSTYVLFRIFFSNTLHMCSSLNVRDQVSLPHKIRDKVIVLYVLFAPSLDRIRGDSELNG